MSPDSWCGLRCARILGGRLRSVGVLAGGVGIRWLRGHTENSFHIVCFYTYMSFVLHYAPDLGRLAVVKYVRRHVCQRDCIAQRVHSVDKAVKVEDFFTFFICSHELCVTPIDRLMYTQTLHQVYQPTGKKAMDEGMIEVKERHAYVVFFKTDESGFVPVGQVREKRLHACTRHAKPQPSRPSYCRDMRPPHGVRCGAWYCFSHRQSPPGLFHASGITGAVNGHCFLATMLFASSSIARLGYVHFPSSPCLFSCSCVCRACFHAHAVAQNVIQSFGSRQDLLNPTKRPGKGLEKAIILAKAERKSMAEVSNVPLTTLVTTLVTTLAATTSVTSLGASTWRLRSRFLAQAK